MATTSKGEPSQDVPIFLRKTYHMIDSCDPEIACWSEDGETFVVKDPVKFEQTIIPQFFKHSKFSSFVRQLNFYSFRKIKYVDTLRIDPKLEAETANYWRFRHDKFRRGHPELLGEIKRMNGQKTSSTVNTKPQPVTSGVKEDTTTKSEVQTLKKRIDEMTKNIDELTAMVKQVSLKQGEQEVPTENAMVGAKRKKVQAEEESVLPDDMPSAMELEELTVPLPPPVISNSRETSTSSNVTDNEFVEQLFSTFNEDEGNFFAEGEPLLPPINLPSPEPLKEPADESNRPDPELMSRLSDALMLLPRDIQAMIVDRLIASITSTAITKTTPTEMSECATMEAKPEQVSSSVAVAPKSLQAEAADEKTMNMPLAAATLAALLHHYSAQVQQQQQKPHKGHQSSLPVVPVHA